jgi:hypothetical protein
VTAAVRAEAAAAREDIRAAGVACPSCGTNMADLPRDHKLDLSLSGPVEWKCATGQPVDLRGAPPETVRDAANINLWDEMRAADEAAFAKLLDPAAQDGRPSPP